MRLWTGGEAVPLTPFWMSINVTLSANDREQTILPSASSPCAIERAVAEHCNLVAT